MTIVGRLYEDMRMVLAAGVGALVGGSIAAVILLRGYALFPIEAAATAESIVRLPSELAMTLLSMVHCSCSASSVSWLAITMWAIAGCAIGVGLHHKIAGRVRHAEVFSVWRAWFTGIGWAVAVIAVLVVPGCMALSVLRAFGGSYPGIGVANIQRYAHVRFPMGARELNSVYDRALQGGSLFSKIEIDSRDAEALIRRLPSGTVISRGGSVREYVFDDEHLDTWWAVKSLTDSIIAHLPDNDKSHRSQTCTLFIGSEGTGRTAVYVYWFD